MSFKFTSLVALLALAVPLIPAIVTAQEGAPIAVNVNMARVLRINAPAATVIVGNPGVADVTIQDPQTLVLTGKSFGQTNLIVLDNAGNPIADTLIDVVQMQAGVLTVYQGGGRTSLSCAPICNPTIMIGDDTAFTANNIASSEMVKSTAN